MLDKIEAVIRCFLENVKTDFDEMFTDQFYNMYYKNQMITWD